MKGIGGHLTPVVAEIECSVRIGQATTTSRLLVLKDNATTNHPIIPVGTVHELDSWWHMDMISREPLLTVGGITHYSIYTPHVL